MHDLVAAALLGIVQGLTEFLPISSSGHLVLFHHLLDFAAGDLFFDVVLHLATLIAVIAVFGGDLLRLLQQALQKNEAQKSSQRLLLWIVLGSLPAAYIGLTAKDEIEALFTSTRTVGILLLINGFMLMVPKLLRRQGEQSLKKLHWCEVIIIGVAQAFAILPGISRSGATITTALFMRYQAKEAARFSFFLFMPAVLGATLLQILDVLKSDATIAWLPLAVGFLTALGTGYVALRWLLAILQRGKFHYFGFYCLIVGLLTLVWFSN